jgi:hypothetical protein
MASSVYMLGSLICLLCAVLLIRRYAQVRERLLLWSGLCFAGLTVSNLLIFVDLVLMPETDLYTYRLVVAAIAMMLLLYGLIWETD